MMFRVGFLFLVSLAAALAGKISDKEFEEKCKILTDTPNCCKLTLPEQEDLAESVKDCTEQPNSSVQQKCIFEKLGYVTPDGEINKEKIAELLSVKYKEAPEILKAVNDKCVDGDLSKYGEKDDDKATYFFQCVEVQVIGHCPTWDNQGVCEGIEESAAECYKLFA